MENNLNKIFEVVSFYDKCRWEDEGNYNLINFYKDDLNNNTKLLTHWLCYITNRQTDFLRIFDVGGFVFSELADCYNETNDYFALLDPKHENSFIRKDNEDKEKYYFVGTFLPNNKIRENFYKIDKNVPVIFKSRFLPADYFSILYTLDILNEAYKKSLTYFIAEIYKIHKNEKESLIQKILFALHLLSYHEIGQKNFPDIGKITYEKIKERTENKIKILQNKDMFNLMFTKFVDEDIFRQKRAWCCLRDFLKSPQFNSYFRESMMKYGLTNKELDDLSNINMLCQLELPGDVWNNNPKFRRCICNDQNITKFDKFNQFLRNHYNNSDTLKKGEAYPEQFDITFDFVPMMCDKNNCDICPIGCIFSQGENFEMTCINDTSKYCPVALVGCGYKSKCCGQEKCELRKIIDVGSHPK